MKALRGEIQMNYKIYKDKQGYQMVDFIPHIEAKFEITKDANNNVESTLQLAFPHVQKDKIIERQVVSYLVLEKNAKIKDYTIRRQAGYKLLSLGFNLLSKDEEKAYNLVMMFLEKYGGKNE